MKVIYSKNQPLTQDKIYTYLSDSVSLGEGTITVDSITGFAIDKILLIGDFGNENSEIIHTHGETPPTGSTITLATNLTFTHPARTKVYILDYDQLEISHASTTDGAKSVLDTIALQADQLETQYSDTTKTSGYYFVRWKDTIGNTYSDYSDPIPFGGYESNQVGKVIEYALQRNFTNFTENINHTFCIDEINACLDYVRGKLKNWNHLQVFDYVLGTSERGIYKFELPSNIYDKDTNQSIYAVKIGKEGNLTWKSKEYFDKEMLNVVHTTTDSEASVGSTSLALTSANGFDDSGTIDIYVDNTLQQLTYTGVTRATNTLTGIPATGDNAISATIPAGTDVWINESEGQPECYTVHEGYLYTYPLFGSSHINKALLLDYFTEATHIDSDNDTLDTKRYDMVKYWLTWAIRSQKENNGKRDMNDGDFLLFNAILSDYIRTTTNSHHKKIHPKINSIFY